MQKAESSDKVIKCHCKSIIVLMVFVSSLFAQSKSTPQPVSTLMALLTGSLELKSATVGQEFTLKTISDVVVDGQLVIPKGARVLGHVTKAVTKGKDQPKSELSLVIEKAVRRDGSEIPLQAIIAALAAPQNNSLSEDPTYGMMHSNEPAQSGANAAAASKASSTASVATANLKGRMDERSVFDENSQGTIGYEDLSLTWHFTAPPPITVISSHGKNVKLQSGTLMLLRMASPHMPR
jgi:uncharacterized coiled-coil protein SlyX